MTDIANGVRERRGSVGLRQEESAGRVGLSRQSLSGIEAGRRVPSTAVALRLARELGCTVDKLFWTTERDRCRRGHRGRRLGGRSPASNRDSSPKRARKERSAPARAAPCWPPWAAAGWRIGCRSPTPRRFRPSVTPSCGRRPGTTDGRTVGGAGALADGPPPGHDTVLCAGCAPAFGMLAARARTRTGVREVASCGSTVPAMPRWYCGAEQVHVWAGAHLFDETQSEFNVPFVRRRLPGRAMLLFNLARWESGLAVAPGNPHQSGECKIWRGPTSLSSRPQPGAAAQELVERLLRRKGVPPETLNAAATARGHQEVARLIALGLADTGITLRAMARAQGLDFVPLAEERFDLVVEKSFVADRRAVHLLDTVCGHSFRRELESLAGHVTRDTGKLIADTSQPELNLTFSPRTRSAGGTHRTTQRRRTRHENDAKRSTGDFRRQDGADHRHRDRGGAGDGVR